MNTLRTVILLTVLTLGLVFVGSTLFLEAIRRPRIGLYLMIVANFANLLLNWLLIEGNMGLPAMGASGATLATAIVRWAALAAMIGYIVFFVDNSRYNIRGAMQDAWAIGRKLRGLGYPMGLAQGLESAAFASLTIFAGYLGASAIASGSPLGNLPVCNNSMAILPITIRPPAMAILCVMDFSDTSAMDQD